MANIEEAKATILKLLKEKYPTIDFQLNDSQFQFSYIGDLGPKIFDEFTNKTILMVTYNINGTVTVVVLFEKLLNNSESIYKITNAFNENCLYGGIYIDIDGLPIYKYSSVCLDTNINLRTHVATPLLFLPSLKSQIETITIFSK